jgi:hypothetical protein
MDIERSELDASRVAAHLPKDKPERTSETPTENNGVTPEPVVRQEALQPSLDGVFVPSPLIEPYANAAPFWHLPLEPNVFYEPPLIVHSQLVDTERVVLLMESYLHKAGYEVEANDLRLRYTQWVKIPATQYEQLRHELEPQRREILQQIRETDAATERAKTEFIQAMATAKIPLPVPPPPKKRTKQPPAPEPITPLLVERALQADFAPEEDVCGEQGVAPVSSRNQLWDGIWYVLLEIGAPIAAGLLLGINLGVITGLLSLEVLQRGEALWLVALAAVIGLFVEGLVGNAAYALMASAAMGSEKRDGIETAEAFPTVRSLWRTAFFMFIVLVMTVAIAVVDALGLHMLYQERLQEAQLTGSMAGEEVPFWVFLIAGVIISAPYIVYKAVKGWREPEIRQREARIAYLRWKHVDRRREEPAVQQAFAKAQEVANLHQRREMLVSALERIERRLDSARTEYVGCTRKFRNYWDELIACLRKEAAPYAYAPRHTPRRRGSNETLLQKLIELFRR